MSKLAKDIKVNDILWTISAGDRPQLLPLIVVNIDIKKTLWIGYYNLTVRLPNGKDRFVSLFDTGERRDYDIPFMSDLLDKLDYSTYEELKNSGITIMACFNKDSLWKNYVDGLERNIKLVEETIERGKRNLIELGEKLNYIKRQYDNIQEG